MSRFRGNLGLAASVLERMVRPRVSKVTIPITYDCNQMCRTCDIWKINRETPSLRSREITTAELERFLTTNRLLWVAFTGGEPFLRRDIGWILYRALHHCSLVSVTTNGFDSEQILSAVGYGLKGSADSSLALNISFEGSEEVHDEVAGVEGSYQKALETLRALVQVGSSRLKVGISYTTSSFNQGRFQEFIQGLGEDFPGYTDLTYGIGQDSPSYYQESGRRVKVAPDESAVQALVREVLPSHSGLDPFTWVGRKYLEGLVNGKRPKCVAGQYSLMLDAYWNVYPCMFFCPDQPVGNLRDVGFDLGQLDSARIREMVDNCNVNCWTPCEAYSTIVFRPWRVL